MLRRPVSSPRSARLVAVTTPMPFRLFSSLTPKSPRATAAPVVAHAVGPAPPLARPRARVPACRQTYTEFAGVQNGKIRRDHPAKSVYLARAPTPAPGRADRRLPRLQLLRQRARRPPPRSYRNAGDDAPSLQPAHNSQLSRSLQKSHTFLDRPVTGHVNAAAAGRYQGFSGSGFRQS